MLDNELPPGRKSNEEIRKEAAFLSSLPFFTDFLESVFDIVLVLNDRRQVVLANSRLLEQFNLEPATVLGKRPGEVMECVNAFRKFGGCGSSEFCRTCGAAQAIAKSWKGTCDIQECRINRSENQGALDLKVKATPLSADDQDFTIFAIMDISHKKRRRILERIFFHDVLNIAGNIQGLTDLLEMGIEGNEKQYIKMLSASTKSLIEEIRAQRELSAAEMDELEVFPVLLNTDTVLEQLVEQYATSNAAEGRTLQIDPDAPDIFFTTDRTLLLRVLGNMVKNALEAVSKGETVTVGCRVEKDDRISFWIHNPGEIDREIQLQLFQRSFSTKGGGRGLGTYSIKLLGEKYLGGKISFYSNDREGTVFQATFPPALEKKK